MKKADTQQLNNFQRIAELRRARKLRQVDMAAILGMSQRNYSHIESGEYDFTSRQLIRLASLFEVSIDYLVGLTDEMNPRPKSHGFRMEIEREIKLPLEYSE